jgi:hypothetical protein
MPVISFLQENVAVSCIESLRQIGARGIDEAPLVEARSMLRVGRSR